MGDHSVLKSPKKSELSRQKRHYKKIFKDASLGRPLENMEGNFEKKNAKKVENEIFGRIFKHFDKAQVLRDL